jgi:2-hydroxycyclohexanecarboxyl-CoA dehydrogenase
MIDLTDKIIVITGSGSGIGRAAATLVAQAGARVAVVDLNADSAAETAGIITAAGGTAFSYGTDVADGDAVLQMRDSVLKDLGVPSTVVNNAGWDKIQPFVDTDRDFWRKVVDINYLGTVEVTHAFLAAMIEEGAGGSLINVASDAARVGSLGEAVYAGAKGGVLSFTKSLAREVARHKITVNCVCPGPTDTPLLAQQSDKVRDSVTRAIPFKRPATPEDVAGAIAFFASDLASYVTGQVLSVSGGLTMVG